MSCVSRLSTTHVAAVEVTRRPCTLVPSRTIHVSNATCSLPRFSNLGLQNRRSLVDCLQLIQVSIQDLDDLRNLRTY